MWFHLHACGYSAREVSCTPRAAVVQPEGLLRQVGRQKRSKNGIIATTTTTHTLVRYRQGMEGQHRRICEILQEMTELVVWGDQNASRANANVNSSANGVVDMFLEKNRRGDRILTDCIQLLKMCGRDSGAREIKRQLLQTFNMLIQNINNDHVINLIMANYMRCGV
jgi:hypothetical protein